MALDLFLFEHLVAPGFEMGKAALETARAPAVEPQAGARHILEETPVMAHHHNRGGERVQLRFQPFDRRQVEMIGRLVEQENIGHRCERARQNRAPRLAAREVAWVFLAGETKMAEQVKRAVAVVAFAKTGLDISAHVGVTGEVRLLREIAQDAARLDETRPVIGLDEPGGDLHQCGLARSVAPDKAHAVAGGD